MDDTVQKALDIREKLNIQNIPTFENGIIVLGNTGAGKSTFLNYLIKRQLEYVYLDGSFKVDLIQQLTNCQDFSFKIGHALQSTTKEISHFYQKSENIAYFDTPGFYDSDETLNLYNLCLIKLLFNKSKLMKVLVVIKYAELKGSKGQDIRKMMRILDQMLGGLHNHISSIGVAITQKKMEIISDENITKTIVKVEKYLKEIFASPENGDKVNLSILKFVNLLFQKEYRSNVLVFPNPKGYKGKQIPQNLTPHIYTAISCIKEKKFHEVNAVIYGEDKQKILNHISGLNIKLNPLIQTLINAAQVSYDQLRMGIFEQQIEDGPLKSYFEICNKSIESILQIRDQDTLESNLNITQNLLNAFQKYPQIEKILPEIWNWKEIQLLVEDLQTLNQICYLESNMFDRLYEFSRKGQEIQQNTYDLIRAEKLKLEQFKNNQKLLRLQEKEKKQQIRVLLQTLKFTVLWDCHLSKSDTLAYKVTHKFLKEIQQEMECQLYFNNYENILLKLGILDNFYSQIPSCAAQYFFKENSQFKKKFQEQFTQQYQMDLRQCLQQIFKENNIQLNQENDIKLISQLKSMQAYISQSDSENLANIVQIWFEKQRQLINSHPSENTIYIYKQKFKFVYLGVQENVVKRLSTFYNHKYQIGYNQIILYEALIPLIKGYIPNQNELFNEFYKQEQKSYELTLDSLIFYTFIKFESKLTAKLNQFKQNLQCIIENFQQNQSNLQQYLSQRQQDDETYFIKKMTEQFQFFLYKDICPNKNSQFCKLFGCHNQQRKEQNFYNQIINTLEQIIQELNLYFSTNNFKHKLNPISYYIDQYVQSNFDSLLITKIENSPEWVKNFEELVSRFNHISKLSQHIIGLKILPIIQFQQVQSQRYINKYEQYLIDQLKYGNNDKDVCIYNYHKNKSLLLKLLNSQNNIDNFTAQIFQIHQQKLNVLMESSSFKESHQIQSHTFRKDLKTEQDTLQQTLSYTHIFCVELMANQINSQNAVFLHQNWSNVEISIQNIFKIISAFKQQYFQCKCYDEFINLIILRLVRQDSIQKFNDKIDEQPEFFLSSQYIAKRKYQLFKQYSVIFQHLDKEKEQYLLERFITQEFWQSFPTKIKQSESTKNLIDQIIKYSKEDFKKIPTFLNILNIANGNKYSKNNTIVKYSEKSQFQFINDFIQYICGKTYYRERYESDYQTFQNGFDNTIYKYFVDINKFIQSSIYQDLYDFYTKSKPFYNNLIIIVMLDRNDTAAKQKKQDKIIQQYFKIIKM